MATGVPDRYREASLPGPPRGDPAADNEKEAQGQLAKFSCQVTP
jgi:hypothetical protein